MKQLLSITTHYVPPFPETHGAARISRPMPGLTACLAAIGFKQDASHVTLKSTVRLEVGIVSALSPQHCHLSLTPLQNSPPGSGGPHAPISPMLRLEHLPLSHTTFTVQTQVSWQVNNRLENKTASLPREKETEKLQK